MIADDEASRKARADRLHAQIDKITAPKTEAEVEAAAESETPAPAETPREFTNRKLNEHLKNRPKK